MKSYRWWSMMLMIALSSPLMADELPWFQHDRGRGVPTSLFGTYVEEGQLLVYPFYEYVINKEEELHASELGGVGEEDFLGEFKQHEYLLFLGYGLTENIALELEGALYTKATLDVPPDAPGEIPSYHMEESGLGDVESQLRWRIRKETETRPAYFSFFEVVFPLQKDKVLIGTRDWEFAAGFGAMKGFRWGTMTGRIAVAYDRGESVLELDEWAIEYLRKTSERWRFVATIEGLDDDISLIGEAQFRLGRHAVLKLNNGFGITEKAEDFAPEVGVLFEF